VQAVVFQDGLTLGLGLGAQLAARLLRGQGGGPRSAAREVKGAEERPEVVGTTQVHEGPP
jgi:hypothetical protein